MIKEVIGVGETELDALNDAKRQLGLDETDEVEFELIQRAEKKKFGLFGGAPAKVKVTLKATPEDKAEEFLRNVLDKMNLQSVVIEKKLIEGGVEFDLSGEDVGFVIGRRGETLDAIQYLASMTANRGDKEYYRITVDCCGYREKRKAILEELAAKIAKTVLRTGRTSTLEPMNPYERRIIHSAVANIEGVTSKSIGEEPYRKVVISSTNPRPKKDFKGDRKPRRRDKNPNEYTPRSMDMMKTSFEKDYKRPKPEDSLLVEGDLYGKIDI